MLRSPLRKLSKDWNLWIMESDWIDAQARPPKEGEIVYLPGIKIPLEVRANGLYNKGQLAIPISIVEKYRIENEEGKETSGATGQ